MMRKWIDESPDRYGPINPGDFVGVTGHFVEVLDETPFAVADVTVCGRPLHWRMNPKNFPVCGVVDCDECLQRMKDEAACA